VLAPLRTVLTYILTSLYILIVGPIGLLIVIPFRWKGLLYELGHAGVALALGSAGIRYRVVGREHIPRGRAVVFCANHQSNVDPPVLFQCLNRRLHILYKAGLRKIPVLGRALEAGGFVAVHRDNRERAFQSIEVAAASVRSGNSFLIFPEGTRSRTDELLPFKKGGFRMAIKAGAPVVPVAISGGRSAMVRGSFIIRPVTLTIRIGRAVETAGVDVEARDALIERVRHEIATLLALGPL